MRSQHFTAVEVLRSELEELGISYKKLEDASHVTAVELNSAKLADSVMKKLDSRGFYVQGKIFFLENTIIEFRNDYRIHYRNIFKKSFIK